MKIYKLEYIVKEYEEECPTCKGYGKIIVGATCARGYHQEITDWCPECEGSGKIDWIDKIKKIKVGGN